jgi:hypothetical protein
MFQGITPEPDAGFVRKLKRFDPKLKCEFDRKCGKFIITQPNRLHSGRSIAAVVEGDFGGGYRQPDNRDIKMLARADFERKSHIARIREGEQYEKQDAHAYDEIKHATAENKRQLRHYASILRGDRGDNVNPAFRRVTKKAKGTRKNGYTVVDKRRAS